MTIKFPSGYSVGTTCTFSTTTDILEDATCSGDGSRTITVSNLLNSDYTGGSSSWTFTFGDVTLSESIQNLSTFTITTLSSGNAVDTYSSSIPFALNEGVITATVTPDNLQSYQQSDYTFEITPANSVPAGGYIVITYPDEIGIEDSSYSQSQCSASSDFPSAPVCTIDTSKRTITITKGFRQTAGTKGTKYTIVVPELTNPLSTSETDTFEITTYNSGGYSIDEVVSGLTVTMTDASSIYSVDISLSSY